MDSDESENLCSNPSELPLSVEATPPLHLSEETSLFLLKDSIKISPKIVDL